MAHCIEQFFGKHVIETDFRLLMLGERLGGGAYREVYRFKLRPDWVVKFETQGEEFCNVAEMLVWQSADPWLKRWLAPCHNISPFGTVMIQEYVEPLPKHRFPKKIPRVLDDPHAGNWGLLNNRPVLVDYGFINTIVQKTSREMREVEWTDDGGVTTKKPVKKVPTVKPAPTRKSPKK